MAGISLIIAFVIAIVIMIFSISKWKVHPFLSIMGVSSSWLRLAGIPSSVGIFLMSLPF